MNRPSAQSLRFFLLYLFALAFALDCASWAQPPDASNDVRVRNTAELRAAVRDAKPGTLIKLERGEYSGGNWFASVRGTADKPIVIAGADPQNPAVIKGGKVGMQFSGAEYLELRDLTFSGTTGNALMIDDAGVRETPAHHIVLRNLSFKDIGPSGMFYGIKMAGVDKFIVENCRFERYPSGSGMAIDCVGCHDGIVENNLFRGRTAPEAISAGGLQFKGGSRNILVRRNRFENAGMRGANIGGSTGVPYFRPPLEAWPAGKEYFEAKDIIIEGNTFIGGDAPVAFVGVDGATVRYNTIYVPNRWALRILQETTSPGFVASRNGVFEDNIIVFRQASWFAGGVNIGPKTAPETFRFARNLWFCEDAPARSKPVLPVAETDGVYGIDPKFREAAKGDFRLQPDSPAAGKGADALPPA